MQPPPETPPPCSSHPFSQDNPPYLHIGEAEGTRALVDHFYDAIRDTSPLLKDMPPDDDTESRDKLFEFLSGWLGGPSLYIQRRGHPRLDRARCGAAGGLRRRRRVHELRSGGRRRSRPRRAVTIRARADPRVFERRTSPGRIPALTRN